VAAVADGLEDGSTTVGASVQLDHLAPTVVGAMVQATAGLIEVDGRTLRFRFEVTDPAGPVARGTLQRVVVDRGSFLRNAGARSGEAQPR
jgi:predicted thioesterase